MLQASQAMAEELPTATNTLHVSFPATNGSSISMASVYEELAPFGEIARLEVSSSQQSTAVVSFYDSRAAAGAAAALGGRAMEGAPYGTNVVFLQGDAQLDSSLISGISAVTESSAGTYVLRFYDTRDAERAMAKLKKTSMCQGDLSKVEPLYLETKSLEAPVASGPRYRNDLRLSEVNWTDLVSGRDKRTTLRLRCLPSKMCDKAAFEKALETAGLGKMYDCLRIFPGSGRRSGTALVNAVDSHAVIAIAKYFHGRQWGRSLPVAVSFAPVQGVAEIERAFPTKPLSVEVSSSMAKAEPWRIEPGESIAGRDEPGVSEVSTEVGDDNEVISGGACQQVPKQRPERLLEFPPGLGPCVGTPVWCATE